MGPVVAFRARPGQGPLERMASEQLGRTVTMGLSTSSPGRWNLTLRDIGRGRGQRR